MEFPEFDIIFAGGGTAACVIAGRLITLDPSLRILVIESGEHTNAVPQHIQPCRYVEHLSPDSTAVSFYVGKSSKDLNGRSPIVSCGRCVGGGSSVNFMVYARGAASDYDDWAAFGNGGWSFKELLPLIKKVETFTPFDGRETHGYSGPISISVSRATDIDIGRQFLKVAKEYDSERPIVDDNNDFETANAYCPAYRYINYITGRRSDAASSYLYPHTGNPNTIIMVGKHVKRVIIENGRAVGLEYVTDAITNPGANGLDIVTVKAKGLIVISAGAFGSPAILEKSGIGARAVLERNKIPVIIDLPGVGENYQDRHHVGSHWAFYGSNETETMNEVWKSPEGLAERLRQWDGTGAGKVAHNGVEAVVKVRLTEAQLASAGPALRERWESFFQRYPDKSMAILGPFSGVPLPIPVPAERKLLSVIYYLPYPDSCGSVHITSGEDVHAVPEFDPSFLAKASDVAQLTIMYKFARELIRRMPAYRGEAAAFHPQFPEGSPAACKEIDDPVPIDAPDIVYSEADEEAIIKFNRDVAFGTSHALGTCAMKPRNQGGVVDSRLNVYGVKGLKVADMSIAPSNVGNNTYSTALLIGEKAAAIIAEDLSSGII